MISQLTVIETQVNGKPYHLFCNPSSSFGDLKEAIFQLSKVISQQEDLALERVKAQAAEKEAEEASKAIENSKEADINV